MKLRNILVILMIILLVGCAKKEVAPEPVVPVQEPVVVEVAPEPEPVVEAPKPLEKPEGLTEEEQVDLGSADVALTKAGFNPDVVTIKKDSSIIIKVLDDNKHALTPKFVSDYRSKSLEKGEDTKIDFSEAGEFRFIDAVYGKWLTVTVTE